jgi:hypothetical protein
MAAYPLAFRTSRWILALVAAGLAISVAGSWHFSKGPGAAIETFGFVGLAVMFTIGLIEGLVARVVLGIRTLEIVSNFRGTEVPRTDIVRAVGEKGVPVAVELRSGGWLKLPALGTGPHANTVRAWLRNAPEGEASEDESH